MTTVYLVTRGCYSDYGVCSVFSTEELAKRYIDSVGGTVSNGWGGYHIEEYKLDWNAEQLKEGWNYYVVRMQPNGNVFEIEKEETISYDLHCNYHVLYGFDIFGIFARDEEHATKIANEQRIKHIAKLAQEGKWP